MVEDNLGGNLIFVCGCGHSGTTLLWAMLSAHPDIYGINYETNIFLNSKKYNENKISKPRKIIANLFNKYCVDSSVKGNSEHLSKDGLYTFTLSDADIISFFEFQKTEALKSGCNIICEKTPRHVLKIDRILSIFPLAKVIVIIRNGLDVVASITERRGNFKNAVHRWIYDNSALLKFKDSFPIYIIRYEDLVKNTQKELNGICNFCNIEYHIKMMSHDKIPKKYQWKLETRRVQVHSKLTNKNGHWKHTLNESQYYEFLIEAYEMMELLGYKIPSQG